MSDKLRAEIEVTEGVLLALCGFCLSPDPYVVEAAAQRRQVVERELANLRKRAQSVGREVENLGAGR